MHRERFGQVWTVFGMQYGSEGKGAITSYLAPIPGIGIRTGASNAGHTLYYKGKEFIMRQLPSSWVNPQAKLVIGRGALISMDVLMKEVENLEEITSIRDRLFIDDKAHVITEDQIREEMESDLAERIGSTSAQSGEGIGQAQADKVMRDAGCVQAEDVDVLQPFVCNTVQMINDHLERNGIVLLEGTQGHWLSLDHGMFPYTTSRDTSVPALAASAGISPHEFDFRSIGVVRTFPIRVGGPSGPFGPDSDELSWKEMADIAGAPESLSEKTTVTKRTRRIATFSRRNFEEAVRINRPTELAVTFGDYIDWSVHEKEQLTPEIRRFITKLERLSDAEVTMVKTGPQAIMDFSTYRRNIIRKVS